LHSKSGPGDTLYHSGFCELAQRQAVLVRKAKPPDRAIKSDRAKVVMTAGCISRTFDIYNYIYIPRKRGNSTNQNLRSHYILVKFYNGVLKCTSREDADYNASLENTELLVICRQ